VHDDAELTAGGGDRIHSWSVEDRRAHRRTAFRRALWLEVEVTPYYQTKEQQRVLLIGIGLQHYECAKPIQREGLQARGNGRYRAGLPCTCLGKYGGQFPGGGEGEACSVRVAENRIATLVGLVSSKHGAAPA